MTQPDLYSTKTVLEQHSFGDQEFQHDLKSTSQTFESCGGRYGAFKSNAFLNNHEGQGDRKAKGVEETDHTPPRVARRGRSGTAAVDTTPKKGIKSYRTSFRKLAERSAKRALKAKQLRLAKYQKLSSTGSSSRVTKTHPTSSDFRGPEFQETSLLIVKEMGNISTVILRQLRTPIAWFLVIVGFVLLLGTIMPVVHRACQPFCIIPGVSSSTFCSALSQNSAIPGSTVPKQAEIATMVDKQNEMFEQLLEAATGGSALSLEIKKAEMATKDLIVLVKISDLGCKDVLAPALSQFVSDARATGRGLQRLAAKVGGAVDNILAVNEYVLRSIEDARANEPAPWSLTSVTLWKPQESIHGVVAKMFDEAMNVLSANMERLIVEAEYSRTNLMDLEEKLTTLHEIVAHDDSTISRDKSELLEHLWTKLGGNRKLLRDFDHHLALLKSLDIYRKQALIHVVAALETLHAMSEDMEDMRERVTAPNLLGSEVPVEVHIRSLRTGMERLREERSKAKRMEKGVLQKTLSTY